jgi:ubiquinone/menaquinone biosynthesis C-methylase UbiE
MQWYGVLLPRIHRHLPTGTILEIACGFGRWTNFLKDSCEKLVAIDLVEKCIEGCRARFADCSHIEYHVNDGRSLDFVDDAAIDFVFSFDSLVHVDPAVIKGYISQLPRILKKGGAAFLHHSNLGEYAQYRWAGKIPKLRGLLSRTRILERSIHNRDLTVCAPLIEQFAREAGLSCVSQELVNWRTRSALIDCFTTLVHGDTPQVLTNLVLRNGCFMREAKQLCKLSELYQGE